MIHTVIFDDKIKVWWDYDEAYKQGCTYRVYKDNEVFSADKTHYSFDNLDSDTEYSFHVEMVDENGSVVSDVGTVTVKTLQKKNVIDVTKAPYNAVGDGKTLNTNAIQHALNDCTASDCVYIPTGTFLTGALDMHSDSELRLADDAILLGSECEQDYLPKIKNRFEGREVTAYRSLINAGTLDAKGGCNCSNVVIRGGRLQGGGQQLRKNIMAVERERILKEHHLENEINPPNFYNNVEPGRMRGRLLNICNVDGVIVADTEIGNAPSWNLHFVYCNNVVTCDSLIFSHAISNGDGWDPDSSTNCVLFGITFDTGDDCVAIKSGKNLEGYLVGRPCEHIRIFDCNFIDGHGIAIGSEMSGGVNDVIVWDCDLKDGKCLCIKTNRCRGGYVKNVKGYNLKGTSLSIEIYDGNNDGDAAPCAPVLENFHFENLFLTGLLCYTGDIRRENNDAIEIYGYKDQKIKNVTIKNVKLAYKGLYPHQIIRCVNAENVVIENVESVGEDL